MRSIARPEAAAPAVWDSDNGCVGLMESDDAIGRRYARLRLVSILQRVGPRRRVVLLDLAENVSGRVEAVRQTGCARVMF